jgi:integrase
MERRRKKRVLWSHVEGSYGARVRVLEKKPGGMLYWTACESVPKTLGHREKAEAIAFAHEKAADLARGREVLETSGPTAARIVHEYLEQATPRKAAHGQTQDRRKGELWLRFLGARLDLERELDDEKLRTFVVLRRTGELDSYGNFPVPCAKRRPVRDRTIESEIQWLRVVIHWAMRRRIGPGRFLLHVDPTRGFKAPTEKNPRRPLMTDDRHEALLSVADQVHPYLRTLLVLAHGTGRRISAICGLRLRDIPLGPTPDAPWGAIRWPADTDKMGKAWDAPITEAVRHELTTRLELARLTGGGEPEAFLFPSPRRPGAPLHKDLAERWLVKAEALAELEHVPGLGWHGYRRLWATSRKGAPDCDVARAGGWSDLRSLKTAYQQADPATILRVVTERVELRERVG